MKLRLKTLIVFSFTLFFLVLTLYLSAGSIIFKSFEDIERKDVNDDIDKVVDYFDQTTFNLEIVVQNLATWADTNEFIQDNSSSYIESNLAIDNLRELHLNIIVFLDASGNVVYTKAYDRRNNKEVSFPQDLLDILSGKNNLVPSSENNYSPSGIVMLSEGPLIFASRPIQESSNTVSKGTFIAGAFFDSDKAAFFSNVHKIPLKYYLLQGSTLDQDLVPVLKYIGEGTDPVYIEPADEYNIMGYVILEDIYGNPALLLEISTPRIIYHKAKTTFVYLLYVIIFAGFLYGAIATVFLERSILSRLTFLTNGVDAAKTDSSGSGRISVSGDDEVSSLGLSINHLMERLDERENLLSSIIESASEGVIVIDENYKITHFNSKFIRMWEIPEEIITERDGLKLLDHLKDRMTDYESTVARLHKYHMSAKRSFSILEFKDSSFFEVSSFPLLQNSEVIGRILSFRDISERKMAEDILREKDHRYKLLFEQSNDAIFIVKDGIIQDLNNKACELICESGNKIIGRSVVDISIEEKQFLIKGLIKNALKESFSRAEMEIRKPDSTVIDAEITVTVVDTDNGLLQFIIRDITERKEIERLEHENKERMSLILDNINSGVIVVDADTHVIVDINPTALDMVGHKKEDVLGMVCHKLICPAEKGQCPISDLNQAIDKSEREIVQSDGTRIPVLKSIKAVKFGGRELFIESFIDITKIKETENDLLAAKVHAETANRTKSEFLATMSHELRTPLNSVIGFSDLLLIGSFGDLNDKQGRFISNISSSGKHLLNLINDILDISKIEAGKMELFYEIFDFADMFSDVHLMMKPMASKKDILLDFEMYPRSIYINADRSKLKQVLYNIIGNAIKFTPENGEVHVKVSTMDNMLHVSIRDTGIGISRDDQAKLFQPFVQLDSSSNRKYGGTGLGLSLVKNLVELHSGSIEVESEPGKGSSFFFSLPLNLKDQIRSTESSSVHESFFNDTSLYCEEGLIILEPKDPTGYDPLILVVEDDVNSRELLSVMLNDAGYRVVLVDDGVKALEIVKTLHPFAITLDLNLPGMDGTEVLENLKNNEYTSSIPVLVLSSLGENDVGLVVGVVDYLTKPIDSDRLLHVLSDLMDKSGKASLKVLIIDDDPLAVDLLSEIIKTVGYDVITAYGGKEGIEKALNRIPDILIVDLMMPEVTGFDVISTLKSDPHTIHIPLIVCTAKDMKTEEIEFLNKNASGIIQKGTFSKEDLLGILGKFGQNPDNDDSHAVSHEAYR
ncbi:response regulator [Methanolobus psychrotolerans]|uniref:response regulator n=1 Tax=Methanolobus psychrotolerans TaxID=1874706 RepID=UPI000B915DBE|nr:response regulator [Methanolobus psychrotolerans]